MKKEPWVLKHGFKILATVAGLMFLYAIYKEKDIAAILMAVIFSFCVLAELYYTTLTWAKPLPRERKGYEKAHYHQARQSTLRLIKGGKK